MDIRNATGLYMVSMAHFHWVIRRMFYDVMCVCVTEVQVS